MGGPRPSRRSSRHFSAKVIRSARRRPRTCAGIWQRSPTSVSSVFILRLDPRVAEGRREVGQGRKIIRPRHLLTRRRDQYMRWNSDHQEMAYILRPWRRTAPETFKRSSWPEANRLRTSIAPSSSRLTGTSCSATFSRKPASRRPPAARLLALAGTVPPRAGPLIGLPWEQSTHRTRRRQTVP